MPFPTRKIGGTPVSAIGLGCMGMSYSYSSFGGFDNETSLAVLTRAADLGVTLWDTSDMYGSGANEELLGRWFRETGRRDEIFLATKFGFVQDSSVPGGLRPLPRGDAAYVREACLASLQRLGIDHVDLYYQHRVDPTVPIEETVAAMAELHREGKVRLLGLSECSAATLRRACAVHPIAAVQMEYSPFALEIESPQTQLLQTARELGVAVVCYSPLGRGFLTGALKSPDDLEPDDNRRYFPRFSEANFPDNLVLVEKLSAIAKKKGITPGQLSLAWLLAQGDDIIPIPGTKKVKYLEENAAAVHVVLTKEEAAEVRKAIESVGGSKGERYPATQMARLFGESPEPKK